MPLFRMYWTRVLKRPGSVLLWLSIPFLFMTIYTMVFGNDPSETPRIGMAVVDHDSSMVSQFVAGAFEQGPAGEFLDARPARDSLAVEKLFKSGDASAALVIPKGFGNRVLRSQGDSLLLYTNPRHIIGPQIVDGIVGGMVTMGNGLLAQFADPMRTVSGMVEREQGPTRDEVGGISTQFFDAGRGTRGLRAIPLIGVTLVKDEEESAEDDFNLAALFFPGLVMFGLLSVSLHLEHRFLVDRNRDVTRRFVMAPVAPWRVALEQRIYTASFIYVVGVISGVLAGIIWRVPPMGLATANLIIIALAIFVSGINGFIFSLSNSQRAVGAISSITMIFLAMLGGGFFPAELTPPAFQAIVKWIPTGMANLALTHCLTGRDPGISIPTLYAYSFAFFALGIVGTRRRVM